MNRYTLGIASFISVVVAALFAPVESTVRIAAICAGAFVAGFLCLVRGREVGAEFDTPVGTVKFFIRNQEPIPVNVPQEFTNASAHAEAVRLCDEGRAIFRSAGAIDAEKGPASTADPGRERLQKAVSLFQRAALLDESYWEPVINQANMMVLLGQPREANRLAAEVELRFADEPLALAKAACVRGQIIENELDPSWPAPQRRALYDRRMVPLFESLRARVKDHVLCNTTLLKSKILAGRPPSEVVELAEELALLPQTGGHLRRALTEDEEVVRQIKDHYPSLFRSLRPAAASTPT